MRRIAIVWLAVAGTTLGGPIVLSAAAPAHAAVVVNRVGEWTLGRLGYADGHVRIRPTPARRPAGFAGTRAFAYELPRGAKQGPSHWYTMDLHVALTLRAGSGGGDIFVDGQTNGWDATQLELSVNHDARGFTTRWQTYDLVDGSRRGEERGRTIVIDERNYLVNAGVRPGLNTFAIRVEEYQRARVQALEALPDSGIGVTTLAVPTVHLTVNTGNPTVAAGRNFTIGFQLTSRGAPVKQISVYPTIDPKSLAFVGPTVRRYAQVNGTVSGTFEFKALRVARTKIEIRALSSADNQPLVEVGVRIDRATGGGATAALAATALGVLLLAFIGTSRRSRRLASNALRYRSRGRERRRPATQPGTEADETDSGGRA